MESKSDLQHEGEVHCLDWDIKLIDPKLLASRNLGTKINKYSMIFYPVASVLE
jgi:hypothetical protein